MSHGHHRTRGAYVLSRAGRRHSARRRGEKLMQTARKIEREEVGAGDAGITEIVTPNFWVRLTSREDSGFATIVMAATMLMVAAFVVGPALLLAKIFYGIRYALLSKLGPMRSWPWYVASGISAVLLFGLWFFWKPEAVAIYWYFSAQIILSLARTGLLIYQYGWSAVRVQKQPEEIEINLGTDEVVVEVDSSEDAETATEETEEEPKTIDDEDEFHIEI